MRSLESTVCSRCMFGLSPVFRGYVAALTRLQLDAAIKRREAAEAQTSDFLQRAKVQTALATVFDLRVTIFQIVEEEKLELEAILNQQRREDR